MQSCLDVVVPYVHDRKQFGKRIGEFQFIQGQLADMYTKLSASRAYVYSVAQAADAISQGILQLCAQFLSRSKLLFFIYELMFN